MLTLVIFATLVAFLILGVPIAVALGLTAVLAFVFMGEGFVLPMVAQRMYSATTGFTLLAIPFFILAGNLMNTGGVTKRVFRFALALVGHFRGGLGHVNVVSSMIFSGMSGAAVADAAGLGLVEMEAMTAAAVALAGPVGFLGLIVPHICRMVLGPDHRQGLIASGLAGAVLLAGAEVLCRTAGPMIGVSLIPVGILTALSGGPFFIYLLRKRFSEAPL